MNVNLTQGEWVLVDKIMKQVRELNKNNVTRTKAYLDFYNRRPEIHWAFLGHMVSRNGGWNMTDLKGDLLPRLLSKKETKSFFAFLERGNWLIFQDIYPQFLLYEESVTRGYNLMHLLAYFRVSTFMETMWNHFLKKQDRLLLAVSLIINEQSYLESTVLKNPLFKKEVLNKLEFKIQDLLSMNHILFPFIEHGELKLIGQTLRHFESVHERILLGKRLYSLLFGDPGRLKMVEEWANTHPHTASRKDYWPAVFNDVNEGVPGQLKKQRIKSCKLLPGATRLYSPNLEHAWENIDHQPADTEDWFHDWRVFYYLIKLEEYVNGEIEHEYGKTLERIELAALAKQAAISFFD